MAQTDFVIDRDNLEIRMSRIFDAPRERLFEASTDPDQIPRWWGPRRYATEVVEMDVRVGGKWRFIQRGADGEYAFDGKYLEVDPPARLTYTFEYEPMAGHISTDRGRYEELPGGRTRLTSVTKFANLEDLEGMAGSGMEEGARETWDRLAELVERPEGKRPDTAAPAPA